MRKAQFEKWSYDHNRKGPSHTNVSTSLLQVSRNSVFCCSTVTANTPWFLHQKEIFNLLGSNFFPLCSLKLLHKVQLHEKVIPAKSHLRLSGLPESHAGENTTHVFMDSHMFGTCLECSLLSSFSCWGSIFSLVKSKSDSDKEKPHKCTSRNWFIWVFSGGSRHKGQQATGLSVLT